ncbi:unnamed protein product [Lampetra fluviatilis]
MVRSVAASSLYWKPRAVIATRQSQARSPASEERSTASQLAGQLACLRVSLRVRLSPPGGPGTYQGNDLLRTRPTAAAAAATPPSRTAAAASPSSEIIIFV